MKHLIFFDGECGFCQCSIQAILQLDQAEIFAFAPLQGMTAKRLLGQQHATIAPDSFVLMENYESENAEIFLYGQGFLRIFWLLGGAWTLVGYGHFIPGFFYNWMYHLVAKSRLWLKFPCQIPSRQDRHRFLP